MQVKYKSQDGLRRTAIIGHIKTRENKYVASDEGLKGSATYELSFPHEDASPGDFNIKRGQIVRVSNKCSKVYIGQFHFCFIFLNFDSMITDQILIDYYNYIVVLNSML